MANGGKWGWLLALGILTLCVTPTAAQRPGIDGSPPPPPPRLGLDRNVIWPTNRFTDVGFRAETEPGNRITTCIYSNVYVLGKGDCRTGWNASLSLRASVKKKGPAWRAEPRVFLIATGAASPMGGQSAVSTCVVVVPVNRSPQAVIDALNAGRAAERQFQETGRPPDGYFVVLESSEPDPQLPEVSVQATDDQASEVNFAMPYIDHGAFLISRTGDTSAPLTVWYTLTGTAVADDDYNALPGSVTIPAGASDEVIYLIPMWNSYVEDPETVELWLSGDPTYTLHPTQDHATVTIEDDSERVNVWPATPFALERNQLPGRLTFERTSGMTLTMPFQVSYTVTYSDPVAVGPGDYTGLPSTLNPSGSVTGTVTIPAGAPSITIDVTPVQDTKTDHLGRTVGFVEGTEKITVTLNGTGLYRVGDSAVATITIVDTLFYGNNGQPQWDMANQGYLDDCWFVAAASGLAYRGRAQEIVALINDWDNGNYRVTLPGRDPWPLGSFQGIAPAGPSLPDHPNYYQNYEKYSWSNGLWLPLLEKAWSELEWHDNGGAAHPYGLIDSSAFNPGKAITILTGHGTDMDVFTDIGEIRQKLTQHLAANHVIVAQSSYFGNDPGTNGIVPLHDYSVLEYDPANDMIQLRNPHGYGEPPDPTGTPNPNDGIFRMRLTDFHASFAAIAYEEP